MAWDGLKRFARCIMLNMFLTNTNSTKGFSFIIFSRHSPPSFSVGESQPLFTSSKSTMETPDYYVKSAQSKHQRHQHDVNDGVLMSLLLTLSRFFTLF